VIPKRLQTPEVLRALEEAAEVQRIGLDALRVGSPSNSVNPRTGQPEFDDSVADRLGLRLPPRDLARPSSLPGEHLSQAPITNEMAGRDLAMTSKQHDRYLAEREAAYNAGRRAAGHTGRDYWRDLGRAAGTLPAALVPLPFLGTWGVAAARGLMQGLIEKPVVGDSFSKTKAQDGVEGVIDELASEAVEGLRRMK
jgi:hypothetical protein